MKNQKNNVTEIVFILDKSGSMSGLESDTIGGFNSMIKKQKAEDGEAYVTTVLFSSDSTMIHDRISIDAVPEMTSKDYFPGGCTALLDAIGDTITHISRIHKYARKEDVPAHTIFVITTDGMENASREYSSDKIKSMIKKMQEKYNWEFIFLGANIDAVETAGNLGIKKDRAVQYNCDSMGTAINYDCLAEAVTSVRKEGFLRPSWRAKADADYQARGN